MIYNQIAQSGPRSKTVGERVLKWLLATQRPLRIDELRAAVSVDVNGLYSALSKRDILAMTCNLVVEDTELGIFRYAHTSVLEYLETRPEFNTSQVNMLLLERCMDTLLHRSIPGYSHCFKDMGICVEEIFKDYASTFWLQHCFSCNDQDRKWVALSKIKKFLFSGLQKSKALCDWEEHTEYWILYGQGDRVRKTFKLLYRGTGPDVDSPTHWYLTCAVGLTEIIEEMTISEINVLNTNFRCLVDDTDPRPKSIKPMGLGMNGLHMAIVRSNEAAVDVLLRKGASILQRTDKNETCISLATTRNNPVVVDLLCEAGADPNEGCPVQMKDPGGTMHQLDLDPGTREFNPRPPTAMWFRQNTRTVLLDEDIETPLHSASFLGKSVLLWLY
jgi:hypothetical protein